MGNCMHRCSKTVGASDIDKPVPATMDISPRSLPPPPNKPVLALESSCNDQRPFAADHEPYPMGFTNHHTGKNHQLVTSPGGRAGSRDNLNNFPLHDSPVSFSPNRPSLVTCSPCATTQFNPTVISMSSHVPAALMSGTSSRSHSLPRTNVSKASLSYSPAMTSRIKTDMDRQNKHYAPTKSSHRHQEFHRASTGASMDMHQGDGHISTERKSSSLELSNRLIAIFDYNARTDEEVSLRKGDSMLVLNDSDSEWWFVDHCRTSVKGYVPSSYVAVAGSVEAEKWYIPRISRKDSERLLLLNCNTRGTFLIRQSETAHGTLTLSVRDHEVDPISAHATDTVKHYRVKQFDGGGYYITTKCGFPSLRDLVEHYSRDANGLCSRLTHPCPRPPPLTKDLSVQTKDKWEVPRTSIALVQQLGSGNFGEVWKALWNGTTEVAVKTLKPGTMSTEEFLKEARIMKAARHPRLVRLYAVCIEEPIYIITELMPNGSLLEFLRESDAKTLTLRHLVDMMAQIASGMAYLERERYIHRDLAARNILVAEDQSVKIADFGLARMMEERYDTYVARNSTKLPIKWTAPEAALVNRFTIKSDVWSFGIVIYEIITYGQVPYPSMNNSETINQVNNGYRMPKPNSCPDPIYEIMLKTWDAHAEKRPTFTFLCDFFDNYFSGATEANYKHAIAAVSSMNTTSMVHVDGQHQAHHQHQPHHDDGLDDEDAEVANLAPRNNGGFLRPHHHSLQHNPFELQRRTIDTVVTLSNKSVATASAQETPMAVI